MITKLKIKMGDGECEMTMEDAKKLYNSLHELFGTDKTVVKHIHEHDWTWTHPWYTFNVPPYTYPMLYTDTSTAGLTTASASYPMHQSGTLTIDATGVGHG